ncbi:MAG: uroporphyrinogen decarboxylase family protein [Kiritimatiellia bacterium]|nr:uroporphyrinogen decarboxylase family protein [Kiritimatiellia bacterium]
MTSRERVMKAIRFEEADRVPVDLGGTTGASGIHVLAYDALRRHLGLPHGTVRSNDVMQQLAVMEEEILQRLHVDVLQITSCSFSPEWHGVPLFPSCTVEFPMRLPMVREADQWTLTDAAGNRYRKPDTSYYFDSVDGQHWFGTERPLATDEALGALERNVKRCYEETDYALAGRFGGSFFSSHPDFLMAMATEPEEIHEVIGRRCDELIQKIAGINQAIGKYLFCITFADDFGAQDVPFISPDMFREMIVPHYKRFTDWLHANTNLKLFLHSCGAIYPLMDDIVDMGVDILNPVQTSAGGMDPARLKKNYGRKIVFWGGGCDTQNVLGKKPTAEVVEHVRERLKILAPGGGFVFNQIHAIQPTVSPEDICAVFDTAHEFGRYPNPG